MWEEQTSAQEGEVACLGEASREVMFGSLKEGSILPGCQVGKTVHARHKGWAEPGGPSRLWLHMGWGQL